MIFHKTFYVNSQGGKMSFTIEYCGYDENGEYFEFDIPIENYAEWYDKNEHLIQNTLKFKQRYRRKVYNRLKRLYNQCPTQSQRNFVMREIKALLFTNLENDDIYRWLP